MNKTWAISSWISFLISVDILSGALRLHEFHNRASAQPTGQTAFITAWYPVTFEREDAQEPEACELRSLLWNCRLSYVLSPSFRELVQGVEHRLAGDPDQPGKRLIQLQDQKNSAGDSEGGNHQSEHDSSI